MLCGRNNENFLIRENIFSHRKQNLLFLPCNMVAVQNLYKGLNSNRSKDVSIEFSTAFGCLPQRNVLCNSRNSNIFLGCTVTQLRTQFDNQSVYKVKKSCFGRKKTLLQVLDLYVFPNLKKLTKRFAQNCRAQHWAPMSMYLRGTPTWWPDNRVIIWNLLWLSWPLIIWTDRANI